MKTRFSRDEVLIVLRRREHLYPNFWGIKLLRREALLRPFSNSLSNHCDILVPSNLRHKCLEFIYLCLKLQWKINFLETVCYLSSLRYFRRFQLIEISLLKYLKEEITSSFQKLIFHCSLRHKYMNSKQLFILCRNLTSLWATYSQ